MNRYIHTSEQDVPTSRQPKTATFSQVTTIIQEAAKLRMCGKRFRISLAPCSNMKSCVVKRYHSCPPFLISMSVQNGAMILWEPLIGKELATYWLRLLSNVTSPLVFTFGNQNINIVHTNYCFHPKSQLIKCNVFVRRKSFVNIQDSVIFLGTLYIQSCIL